MEPTSSVTPAARSTTVIYVFFALGVLAVLGLLVLGVFTEKGVVIRKLRRIEAGESLLVPKKGVTYVPWSVAAEAIRTCQVKTIFETPAERTVQLTFWGNDQTWEALQTRNGELKEVFDESDRNCTFASRIQRSMGGAPILNPSSY